jgi:tRNA A37 threonylcarbamoyladenosine biosynthesis protein TsaE
VSLIEWFEHVPANEVDEYLELKIAHGGGTKRQLTFVGHGERYEGLIEELRKRNRSRAQKVQEPNSVGRKR